MLLALLGRGSGQLDDLRHLEPDFFLDDLQQCDIGGGARVEGPEAVRAPIESAPALDTLAGQPLHGEQMLRDDAKAERLEVLGVLGGENQGLVPAGAVPEGFLHHFAEPDQLPLDGDELRSTLGRLARQGLVLGEREDEDTRWSLTPRGGAHPQAGRRFAVLASFY